MPERRFVMPIAGAVAGLAAAWFLPSFEQIAQFAPESAGLIGTAAVAGSVLVGGGRVLVARSGLTEGKFDYRTALLLGALFALILVFARATGAAASDFSIDPGRVMLAVVGLSVFCVSAGYAPRLNALLIPGMVGLGGGMAVFALSVDKVPIGIELFRAALYFVPVAIGVSLIARDLLFRGILMAGIEHPGISVLVTALPYAVAFGLIWPLTGSFDLDASLGAVIGIGGSALFRLTGSLVAGTVYGAVQLAMLDCVRWIERGSVPISDQTGLTLLALNAVVAGLLLVAVGWLGVTNRIHMSPTVVTED